MRNSRTEYRAVTNASAKVTRIHPFEVMLQKKFENCYMNKKIFTDIPTRVVVARVDGRVMTFAGKNNTGCLDVGCRLLLCQ